MQVFRLAPHAWPAMQVCITMLPCHGIPLSPSQCMSCRCLQVRATSLQELVYKQGQAGVTKASVSITFHNNDPKNGPTGYEDKEYITVTRQVCEGVTS